jgi:tetratricopeptide (TPR) repeat protein
MSAMLTSSRQVAIGIVICLMLRPCLAFAEGACSEGDTPEASREIAAAAFTEGQRLYDAGDYRGAIERFRCSFQLVPHPNTLFNIGESAELAGDSPLALETFRQYLEQYPDGRGREQAESRVRALEALAGRHVEPEPETPEPDVQSPEAPPPQPETPIEETRMTGARRAAWATLALGVAIAATGGALYGVARSRNGDYVNQRDECSENYTPECAEDARNAADEGEAYEGAGWALIGIGAASLVASIVLFAAFDGSEPVESSGAVARITPLIGDGVVGLSVGGRF